MITRLLARLFARQVERAAIERTYHFFDFYGFGEYDAD